MKKNKNKEVLSDNENQEAQKNENQEAQKNEEKKTEKKHYLRGLFVYGSIVYSDDPDATFQMTDEIAEALVASNPEYKQLFKIWDGQCL